MHGKGTLKYDIIHMRRTTESQLQHNLGILPTSESDGLGLRHLQKFLRTWPSNVDPGPPPDGGIRASTQVLTGSTRGDTSAHSAHSRATTLLIFASHLRVSLDTVSAGPACIPCGHVIRSRDRRRLLQNYLDRRIVLATPRNLRHLSLASVGNFSFPKAYVKVWMMDWYSLPQ